MRLEIFFAAIFCLIGSASVAEARVFDFRNEKLAIYFGGTFGTSRAGDSAFGASSGPENVVTIDSKGAQTETSGELGLLFVGQKANLRIGVEYLQAKALSGLEGKNASGDTLFTLDSKLMAIVLTATLELLVYRNIATRGILGLAYGLAFVNLDNEYTMTPPGTAALGKGSFKETGTAKSPVITASTSWEFLLTDTVTTALTLGYRYAPVRGFKSNKDTDALSGQQTDSSDLMNNDGGYRTTDLSGAFVGLAFRFYIGF